MTKVDVHPIIAHRGASGYAPENTFVAIEKAAEMGATWIEFDCMLTRDGRVVLNHDETLERTAGLEDRLCDLDLADLLHLDVGSWFDPQFAGETIPTFRQTLDQLARLNVGANVEIKPCKGKERETGEAVAKEIAAHWPSELPPPVISSFSTAALEAAIPHLPPEAEVAQLWSQIPGDWQDQLADLGAIAVHTNAIRLEEAQAREIIAAEIPLRCYTVNEKPLADKLFGWGVTSIFTDFPDQFIAP